MKSILYLLILSLLWGSSFFLTKGLLDYFTPTTIVFIRCVFGLIALVPFLLLSKEKLNFKVKPFFLLSVALAAAIPWNFMGTSLKGIDSSLSGILNATTPLFAVVFTIFIIKVKPLRNQVVSLLVGFSAVVILLVFSRQAEGAEFSLIYALIMFGAPCSYALNSIFINKHFSHVLPIHLAFWTLAVAVMLNGPISLLIEPDFITRLWSADVLIRFFVLGCLSSGFGYVLFYLIVSLSGPLLAVMVTFIVPFVSITLGVLFLDEPLHIGIAIGLPLMIISLLLMNIHTFKFLKRPKKPIEEEI